jgi:putative membrane protein
MTIAGDNQGRGGGPDERPRPEWLRMPPDNADRWAVVLLMALLSIMAVAGRAPYSREDWLLENALLPPVVVALAALAALRLGRSRTGLSRTAWVALFLFLLLHEIGAHYTYSLVPYRHWVESLGLPLGDGGRNHYDRVVHFAYGLLVAQPVAELLAARAGLAGKALLATTVAWIAFGSMLYELVESAAAMVFGGDLGIAYLGTQGDAWDAQKDMVLALCGSVLWGCLRAAREAVSTVAYARRAMTGSAAAAGMVDTTGGDRDERTGQERG